MTDRGGIVAAATGAEALSTEEPVGRSTGWWGMVLFVATESTFFACLLGSYYYLRFQVGPQWPPDGIGNPELTRPLVMTGLLLFSSVPLFWGVRGIRYGRRWRLRAGLVATMVLVVTFLTVQGTEYVDDLKILTPTTDVYGSLYYLITGFHSLHVLGGLAFVAWLFAASLVNSFDPQHYDRVRNAGIFWVFLDVVWVAVLFTIYLSPRL
ncbi:cytochrome c oxidase subunit 3 [Micromonospora sp. NPDC006766]|uniref:cytochrome c oxidase subunit 3 n=1 Tax=Micromonospora sp. NPDC006766 TaxID=3154778 RepID=UPI0033C7726B